MIEFLTFKVSQIQSYLKKKTNLLVLYLEIILMILGVLSLTDHLIFLATKLETTATVIRIDSVESTKQYKVFLKYFNTYSNRDITSFVEDVPYEKAPKKCSFTKIYYYKYSPKIIYLSNYKYPNSGFVIVDVIFLSIIISGIFFQYQLLKK